MKSGVFDFDSDFDPEKTEFNEAPRSKLQGIQAKANKKEQEMYQVLSCPADYQTVSDAVEEALTHFPIEIANRKVLIKPNVLRDLRGTLRGGGIDPGGRTAPGGRRHLHHLFLLPGGLP